MQEQEMTMKLRSLTSTIALAACLAFSGSAMAQTMIGGVEVPADQLPAFQEKCAALAAASTQSLAGDQATEADSNSSDTTPLDPAAKANVEVLLGSLTAEQCMEAKLMPEGAMAADAAVSGDAMAAAAPMSKEDPAVIEACAAIKATATQTAAGDQATEANSNSSDTTPLDPASKSADVTSLDAKACADLGL
jgi:hypothetical protein